MFLQMDGSGYMDPTIMVYPGSGYGMEDEGESQALRDAYKCMAGTLANRKPIFNTSMCEIKKENIVIPTKNFTTTGECNLTLILNPMNHHDESSMEDNIVTIPLYIDPMSLESKKADKVCEVYPDKGGNKHFSFKFHR